MTMVAGVQMASGPQVTANLIEAERLLMRAAQAGARIAVLPEHFACMGLKDTDKLAVAEAPGRGPIQDQLARIAQREGLWIVAGTVPLRAEGSAKVSAACLVFDAQGQQIARFDKMHLFDVHLPASEETYRESATQLAGDQAVVVDTPAGRMGLAVCYDLRFPELFRAMVDAGAEWFALPAAFTQLTGQAHWELLLRARAVENLMYGVAAAQGGYHANGRETFGHSLIVDPWGAVVDVLPRGSGIVLGDVDTQRVHALRTRFPALSHRRFGVVLP
ncbi:MAG TPA: carbon-nitrogen hydrolase family protein [Candidatus Macondimonas sp.]|nr:carbon-nitrogen hydrolase family protein [Candidatus Macondimonas sp.]